MGYLLGEDGGCGWHDLNLTTWTDAYMCFKNVIPPPLQHLQIVPIICSRHRPIGGGRQRSLVPSSKKAYV